MVGTTARDFVGRLPVPLQDLLKKVARHARRVRRYPLDSPYYGKADQATRQTITGFTSSTVIDGPFAGLRFTEDASWADPIPMLLGTYEAELHPYIEAAISDAPEVVVDIGCAEGYYAIGMALRLPHARVRAFDIDPAARRLCADMAAKNEVEERVSVEGLCRPIDLMAAAGPSTLVISDCEGFESELFLNSNVIEALRESTLIIELHDFIVPGVSAEVASAYAASHILQLVSAVTRYPSSLRLRPPGITEAQLLAALHEHRPVRPFPMRWAVLTPR